MSSKEILQNFLHRCLISCLKKTFTKINVMQSNDVDFFCRYTVHKLGKLMLFVKLFVTYNSLLLLLFIIYVLLEVLTFSFCVSSPDELQFDPTVSSGHFGQLGKRQRKTAG